jgi:hypothetical protein
MAPKSATSFMVRVLITIECAQAQRTCDGRKPGFEPCSLARRQRLKAGGAREGGRRTRKSGKTAFCAVNTRSSNATSTGARMGGGGRIAAVADPLGQYAQCDD